jgi:ketosteroid isomerase-like protein
MDHSEESVARTFVGAINRHDLEGLTGLMPEGHRFIDSRGNVLAGREKVRSGWEEYFRLVHDYSIELHESFCRGPVVVMIGVAEGSYAVDGQLTMEDRWSTPAAFRAFVEDGKVTEWRVFADNEPVRKRMRRKT